MEKYKSYLILLGYIMDTCSDTDKEWLLIQALNTVCDEPDEEAEEVVVEERKPLITKDILK